MLPKYKLEVLNDDGTVHRIELYVNLKEIAHNYDIEYHQVRALYHNEMVNRKFVHSVTQKLNRLFRISDNDLLFTKTIKQEEPEEPEEQEEEQPTVKIAKTIKRSRAKVAKEGEHFTIDNNGKVETRKIIKNKFIVL